VTGTGKNFFRSVLPEERRADFAAAGIILLYCIVWVSLRLLVSGTMEGDEAEQFLAAKVIALGYSGQPPLFTWILRAAAFPFGMNIVTILAVKYALLFCFYYSSYHTARTFWGPKKSLVVTGALLLFPTYSYEFNRNLTHTILLAAMASVTFLVFVKLLEKKSAARYLLFGAAIGLGILSKYNFVFLLFAIAMASLSTREGRAVLFDRKMLLTAALGTLILLPHVFWLVRQNFPSVHEAFSKAHAGQIAPGAPLRLLSVVLSSFVEAFAFPLVFLAFFRRRPAAKGSTADREARLFRLIPLYGLLLPPALVFIFHMGHFSGKWLAPVFFTIPLALFSSFEAPEKPLRVFGGLCVAAAIAVFAIRAVAGFFPDLTGKVERIHIPFREISHRLEDTMRQRGIIDPNNAVIVTGDGSLAANLEQNIPRARYVLLGSGTAQQHVLQDKTVVAVWDATRDGPDIPKVLRGAIPPNARAVKIEAPYAHSSPERFPPFTIGVVVVRGEK
jgi:4-amino-4-deoxy-L-arabinose transferase-like glycosyltransferase